MLTITGGLKGEGLPQALAQHHRPVPVLGASLFTGGRGEESFVVLDKGSGTKRQTGDGTGLVLRPGRHVWQSPFPPHT